MRLRSMRSSGLHLNVTNDQRVQAQLGERVERYVDDELEVAKKAGAYLQLFARTQRPDWAGAMEGVNRIKATAIAMRLTKPMILPWGFTTGPTLTG